MQGLETLESKLLLELKTVNGAIQKQLRGLIGAHYVNFNGLMYNTKKGAVGGNTIEVLILASVGDKYPADLVAIQRIGDTSLTEQATKKFGLLPVEVPGLHKETAADLMAAASTQMNSPNMSVVQILLDIPMVQRSKQFYLKKIETFFQNCKEPVALVHYLGNSEKTTGNWCFKDGTISFQEIFNIYRRHPSVKCLDIQTDCSYSGQWVRKCAKTLDSLHIPPCGHRARENGALVRVFPSCRPDQEAAEPGYSVEGVKVKDDASITHSLKQLTHQKPLVLNSTKLVCCRGPYSPCPKATFQHLTWENAVDKSTNLQLVQRREGQRDMWYYLLLHRAGDVYREEFQSHYRRDPSLRLSDWGYILESGEGCNPPQEVKEKVKRWIRTSR
ncbi:hypothetical protein GBAR_LOCUS25422 [Geodia barretti]|uniref:Uncharacterized protein n=2 Tax=Geodia barretti TaxID=519541 RepID=A0AA35TCW3_GEOBA|nr:hypothetical protein GBAR_LOCUS25422 [Geodia barretti]